MGELIRDWVFPLGVVSDAGGGRWDFRPIGTGFLLAGAGGAGLTARHVSDEFVSGATAGLFVDEQNQWVAVPVLSYKPHPHEDTAAIWLDSASWLPSADNESPLRVSMDQHHASGRYRVWGYPSDAQYDRPSPDGRFLPTPDLVYTEGHIRRRLVDPDLPGLRAHKLYELGMPAGAGSSGAPVLIHDQSGDNWKVIGVYIGERHNESEGIRVGFSTLAGGDPWFEAQDLPTLPAVGTWY